jgi:hypothetical protein
MKALRGAVVLGIAILMVPTGPALAQVGSMSDAAKEEMMKRAAEKAGIPTPGAPAGTPAAAPDAAAAPTDEPAEDADAAVAPGDEAEGDADAAAGSDADADAADAPSDEAEPAADAPAAAPTGDEADDPVEGARKMIPKLP